MKTLPMKMFLLVSMRFMSSELTLCGLSLFFCIVIVFVIGLAALVHGQRELSTLVVIMSFCLFVIMGSHALSGQQM